MTCHVVLGVIDKRLTLSFRYEDVLSEVGVNVGSSVSESYKTGQT